MHGFRANQTPGSFQIRVVASRGEARAGLLLNGYIAEPRSGIAARPRARRKWLVVALAVVAGAATAGLTTRDSAPASSPAPAPPQVGPPAITVGKP